MIDKNQIEILLVEDNPNDTEMAMRAFKKHNLFNKVVHAKDGEEAVNFIRKNKNNYPKIILLDLNLPKLDGLEVLKILKSNSETKAIPVVILTTSNEEKDMIESYKLGVNSYILKPVDFDKFVEAIKDIGYYWLILNKLPV